VRDEEICVSRRSWAAAGRTTARAAAARPCGEAQGPPARERGGGRGGGVQGGALPRGEVAAVGQVRGGAHTRKHENRQDRPIGTLPDGTIHGNTELIGEEEGGGITLLWRRRRIEGIRPMGRLGNRCLLPRWTAGWL
jgi:hypothetical protein